MKNTINRQSPEYKLWRANVYARDGWICRYCNTKAKRIEAHHIKPVRDYPKLALKMNNGITLCKKCHRTINGKEHLLAEYFTALIENGVNSVETLNDCMIEDNTEPSLNRNDQEGVTTRKRVFRIEQFYNKQVKCVICKKQMERHYHRVQKAKRFFCGNECRGKWMKGRVSGNKRVPKVQKCQFCKKNIKLTPSDKHRTKKFCNNSCQMKYQWRVTKRNPLDILKGRWTKMYKKCIECGTKEKPHYGKGKCMTCYNRDYNSKQRQ